MAKKRTRNIENKSLMRSAVIKQLTKQLNSYFLIAGFIASNQSTAETMGASQTTHNHQCSVIASLGYSNYQSMYSDDGLTVIGRIAFGKELLSKMKFTFGLELGAQNGNSMRMSAPQAILDELGGLPIQTTAKPMFDLLVTANTLPLGTSQFFGQLKSGIAYRHWQFNDRTSIPNVSNLDYEIQAGIGFPISQTTILNVLYQGIFGGKPNLRVNATTAMGSVSTIPIQQGILLSLSLPV